MSADRRKNSPSPEPLDEVFDAALSALQDDADVDIEHLAAEFGCDVDDAEHAVRLAATTLGRAGLLRAVSFPTVADYEILSEIGRGGMSVVYAARQLRLGGRIVALKILPNAAVMGADARRRFLDEARAIARFRHPNVVPIYDVIDAPMLCAYAMEWIEGPTLAALIDARVRRETRAAPPLGDEPTPVLACRIGIAIARALAVVHHAGLVHRDVKPSNILIRADGVPLLSDFGLVRDRDASLRTRDGVFVGTAAYAAPEQLRVEHEAIDARSDIYALGVTLYHLLAGRRPFDSMTPADRLRQLNKTPPRLRDLNRDLSRDLETVVQTAMAPEPDQRYQSADALADDLERVRTFRAIQARSAGPVIRTRRWMRRHRRPLIGAATGAAAVIAMLVLAWGLLVLRPAAAAARLQSARLALLNPQQSDLITQRIMWGDPEQAAIPDLAAALAAYDASVALSLANSDIRRERTTVRAVVRAEHERASAASRSELSAAARAYLEGGATPDWARTATTDLWDIGLIAYLRGDLAGATGAWSELEGRGDPPPFVEAALGQVLLWRGRPELAYPRLLRAVDAFPEVGFLLVHLADAALQCGDIERARRLLDQARAASALDGTGGLARVNADLLAATGRTAEAAAAYEAMPGNPIADLHYGRLLESQGDWAGALERWRQAGFRLPATARAYLALANRAWREADAAARFAFWRRLIARPLAPRGPLEHLRALARASAQLERLRREKSPDSEYSAALTGRTSAAEEGGDARPPGSCTGGTRHDALEDD